MRAIQLGQSGHILGGDVPLACVPIVAANVAAMLSQAKRIATHVPRPDLVELRADHLQGIATAAVPDLLAQLHAALGPHLPILFTNRRRAEGGAGDGDEDARLASIASAATSGLVTLVDVELAVPVAARESIRARAVAAGGGVIVSAHDFGGTPDDAALAATLAALIGSGADVAKLAVTPQTPADVLRLLRHAALGATDAAVPLIIIAMGAVGTITRLAGPFYGSALSFATIGPTSAPGQLSLTLLRDYWHAACLRSLTQ